MKRLFRYSSILLCLLLCLSACKQDTPPAEPGASSSSSAVPPAEQPDPPEPLPEAPPPEPGDDLADRLAHRYGRSFLSLEQQQVYDDYYRLLSAMDPSQDLPLPRAMTEDETVRLLSYFVSDNPEFFWAEPQYMIERTQGSVSSLAFSFRFGLAQEEVQRRWDAVLEQRDILLADLPDDPAAISVVLHDRILAHVTYDTSADTTGIGNLYGALVQGYGVCDAYSKTYQYLLQELGIPCIYLQGTTDRGTTHSWNAVKLNGVWHYSDITWDDQEHTSHAHLNISSAEIAREHYWDIDQYPLIPQSGQTTDYYAMHGYVVPVGQNPAATLSALAAAFARQFEARAKSGETVYLEVKIPGDSADYLKVKNWFLNNIFGVFAEMDAILRASDAAVRPLRQDTITCNYNDMLQILILLPQAE